MNESTTITTQHKNDKPMTSVVARPNKNHDAFLASMTFATGCDCDECELDIKESVPPTIADAIQGHKRRKLLDNEVVTCQERELVARLSSGVSIWKLTMPPGADPMIEFGNSHRIVLVHQCPKNRIVKSVGKGIIGSSHEGRNRLQLSLQEKKGYVLKSNEGRATGFINEKISSDHGLDINDDSHDIVFYIMKITLDVMKEFSTISDGDELTAEMVTIVNKYLDETKVTSHVTTKEKEGLDLRNVSADDLSALYRILGAIL